MTDEERCMWEGLVKTARESVIEEEKSDALTEPSEVNPDYLSTEPERAIIAADAELAALRGEVERLKDHILVSSIDRIDNSHLKAEVKRLLEVVEVAKRWVKRKGHSQDHDCDLCNAIRRAGEG